MPLPSGGWITIEGTEALTAVDVNSGSFTASTGLEETSLSVNLEAADEIGRQVRLRGIGGLIVVDFIHLSEPDNIEKVLDTSGRQPRRKDHTPTQISPMSEFGLVEITRKRVRDPLVKLMSECCRPCSRPRPQAHARQRGAGSHAPRRAHGRRRAGQADRRARGAAKSCAGWRITAKKLRTSLARRGAARVTLRGARRFAREGFDVATAA